VECDDREKAGMNGNKKADVTTEPCIILIHIWGRGGGGREREREKKTRKVVTPLTKVFSNGPQAVF
jgi:hypothetical protein